MEWRDEGMVLSVRKHGETSLIVDVLTKEHGRHAGVVRGGMSRKLKPVLQSGSQVQVDWNARLENHLGTFRIEPIRSRAAQVLGDRLALEGLNAICSLVGMCLGERQPAGAFYELTLELVDQISGSPDWLDDYARWEAILLNEMGQGLDLTVCASSGQRDDLIYVSPKSGRAVSREAGAPWADRLLPLPVFLKRGGAADTSQEIIDALMTTGFFLRRAVSSQLGRDDLPDARDRFVSILKRQSREG